MDHGSMPQESRSVDSSVVLILAVVLCPTAAFADAIFPSLLLVWPITILLFIPVVLIETAYARWQMPVGFWKLLRVTAASNLISAIAGLPIAQLLSTALKYLLEAIRFRDVAALRAQAPNLISAKPLSPHDTGTMMWLGLYPRWIMLVSAVVMVGICYVISWWIEGAWLRRYIKRTAPELTDQCTRVARNANALSYVFLLGIVIWVLVSLWPSGVLNY
jgi:hypothetical protein